MEEIILISYLNDFVFCPVSIYFHKLYGNMEKVLYQTDYQLQGTQAHQSIDRRTYSSKSCILQGIDIYTKQFGICGKIDIYDKKTKTLLERKNKITKVYEGYVFQVYAQYYALEEMGYPVKKIQLHSIQDNKNYSICLPCEDKLMDHKFKSLIKAIREFDMEKFVQTNPKKCKECIYEPSCDRSKIC